MAGAVAKVGVEDQFLLPTALSYRTLRTASGCNGDSAAEQAGFDWIGSNEHHFSPYGMMPNPNLVGAIVAHRTQRVGILQSGNIVPILNPIRVAEEYAMLDVISGGRLIAGFMRGIPHEYVAYNIAPDESYGRLHRPSGFRRRCPQSCD